MKRLLLFLSLLLALPAVAQEYEYETYDTVAVQRLPEKSDVRSAYDTVAFSQRQFREKYRDDYTGKPFDYDRPEPEKSLWERFTDWLKRSLEKWLDIEDARTSASIMVWMWRIVVALSVVAVVYLIACVLLKREGKWLFSKNNTRILRFEDAVVSMNQDDLDRLLAEAIAKADHRLAVRYYYLLLLRKLNDIGHIEFDREKTNSDYLYEIRDTAVRERFRYLSYLYDYIWYGQFEADEALFKKTQEAFRQTLNSLS